MQDSGKTLSVWMNTDIDATVLSLQEAQTVDVCIIGAGSTGLACAYLLLCEGKSVIVLDDGPIAGGETARTTAHLSNILDDRYYELIELFGQEGARIAAESHTAAIHQFDTIIKKNAIECDWEWVDTYLFVPPNESQEVLEKEKEACSIVGIKDVEFVNKAPFSDFDTGRCLHFSGQAQIHPLKYISGLVKAIQSKGGKIFTGVHATSCEDGNPCRVETKQGIPITAKEVIVATNSPINDRFTIHTKQAAYRTYVIAGRVPKGLIGNALYYDTLDPYHYVRLQKYDEKHDYLIVGGEDHKTGQSEDCKERFKHLEAWTRQRIPQFESVDYQWSGQVMEPIDGLAYIGRNPGNDHIYIVTGDSGNGFTHGMIGGMLLRDLILQKSNPWEKIYDPSRINFKAYTDFIEENVNVAVQYAKWLTPSEKESLDKISKGEGAVLNRGLKKIAVYRDLEGNLHTLSAVCPHLGCVVKWNSCEKSWDCPCHGSRFKCSGDVVNGPANTNLKELKEDL